MTEGTTGMVEMRAAGAASTTRRWLTWGEAAKLAFVATPPALAALTAWYLVTGPLALTVASWAVQVRATRLDPDVPAMLPWAVGGLVGLLAWSAWGSVANVLGIPFLSSGLSLAERARSLVGDVLLAALLLGLGAATVAYACHLVVAAGGDPYQATPWALSAKGLDRLYDDPWGVAPAAAGLVGLALVQCGLTCALGVPGTAAFLLARPPRTKAANGPASAGAAR